MLNSAHNPMPPNLEEKEINCFYCNKPVNQMIQPWDYYFPSHIFHLGCKPPTKNLNEEDKIIEMINKETRKVAEPLDMPTKNLKEENHHICGKDIGACEKCHKAIPAPSPKESKGWEEGFDERFLPKKTGEFSFSYNDFKDFTRQTLEEQRKEILDNFKALSDGKPIYYIQHSDKWSHWRCVCGRQNSDDALEKQRRDSLKKPQNHH